MKLIRVETAGIEGPDDDARHIAFLTDREVAELIAAVSTRYAALTASAAVSVKSDDTPQVTQAILRAMRVSGVMSATLDAYRESS